MQENEKELGTILVVESDLCKLEPSWLYPMITIRCDAENGQMLTTHPYVRDIFRNDRKV